MLLVCLTLSALVSALESYLPMVEKAAMINLENAVTQYNSSEFVNYGNLTKVEFNEYMRTYACSEAPDYDNCLNGSLDEHWKASMAKDKFNGKLYDGIVYRIDRRPPAQALAFKLQGQAYLRKVPGYFELLIGILKHLKTGSSQYTSTAYDHEGALHYLIKTMDTDIQRCSSTLWVDKHTGEIVDCPFDLEQPSARLHPKYLRIGIMYEYRGRATGVLNKELIFPEEHEVTTVGFQPTEFRVVAAWFPPSRDFLDRTITEDMQIFRKFLLTTKWQSLIRTPASS